MERVAVTYDDLEHSHRSASLGKSVLQRQRISRLQAVNHHLAPLATSYRLQLLRLHSRTPRRDINQQTSEPSDKRHKNSIALRRGTAILELLRSRRPTADLNGMTSAVRDIVKWKSLLTVCCKRAMRYGASPAETLPQGASNSLPSPCHPIASHRIASHRIASCLWSGFACCCGPLL